ncbi:MAG: ATP-binding protein [Thalassobaculaceae bacterium]
MDLILPIISNIGLLALAAIVYSAMPGFEAGTNRIVRSSLIGLGLGLTAVLVMLTPIEFAPGVIYDARNAPLLLSGLVGGPVAALIALIPPVAVRASIGGVGMVTGIVGMVAISMCSVVAWAIVRRRTIHRVLPALLLYTAASSIISLPAIMLIPDKGLVWRLVTDFGPVIILTNVAGVGIWGLMIAHESRRRALVADLRESESAAREALAVRNRFISMMSHEVRTPLNAILGYAQLLRDDNLNAGQQERVDRLSVSAKNLLRLIDDILHFSQYQDRHAEVAVERWSLPQVVDDALSTVRADAAGKGLALRLPADGVPALLVEVDGPRLRRCLVNILSNAVKFTDRGHVAIAVSVNMTAERDGAERDGAKASDSEGGARLRISVTDTGPGIDEDRVERVFTPFERLGAVSTGGTGLGMAIVRAAVDAMGGSVSIASQRGAGTTVTLEIPTTVHGPAAAPAPAPEIHEYRPARDGTQVLVVDDIDINADIACAFLEQVGCRTAVAVNGADAVEAVRAGGVDAVLMDIEMPVMDGLEATRAIRDQATEEPARSVPIVALTAYASRNDMIACLDAGMNGYLSKPIDKVSLFDALVRVKVLSGASAPEARAAEASAGRPARSANAAGAAEAFSADRYAALAKLVPQETLQVVLEQAAAEIESLGAQVAAAHVDIEDKRQALHKMVSIAGNIGLLRLSALSRRLQDGIRGGGTLEPADIQEVSDATAQALAKIAELRSDKSPAI